MILLPPGKTGSPFPRGQTEEKEAGKNDEPFFHASSQFILFFSWQHPDIQGKPAG